MVEGGCVTEGAHLHERRVRREGEAAAELLLVEVLEAEDGVADGTAIVLTRRLVRRHEVDETHLPEVLSLGLGPAPTQTSAKKREKVAALAAVLLFFCENMGCSSLLGTQRIALGSL